MKNSKPRTVKSQWFLAKETLPADSDDYLVSDGNAIMVTCFCAKTGKWNLYDSQSGRTLIEFWDDAQILFWAPLPELPSVLP